MNTIISRIIALAMPSLLLALTVASCGGEDYTPVYFPPEGPSEAKSPAPSAALSERNCSLKFTSQLCVEIKGDNMEAGTNPDEKLCAEVPEFPLHVAGTEISIKGSEFPDIQVEGHGLPVPITINARGEGDGSAVTAKGNIDAEGNITVKDFTLYILALGVVGEVGGLTLTTGETDELPHLPAIVGQPPDASGAMTLVAGTLLGHTIDAADKYLKGASLSATFTGSITPPLSECGGIEEKAIEVTKVAFNEDGSQTETNIPDGSVLEVSNGTYIADGPADVGPNFEAAAKFRVKNIGTKPQRFDIPPRKGPFYLSSAEPLTGTIAPQGSFILTIKFKPTSGDTKKRGIVREPLAINGGQFIMSAKALSKSGDASVNILGPDGSVLLSSVDTVEMGTAAIPAAAMREFFKCNKIECGRTAMRTTCAPCPDPATTACELLPVSIDGMPLGEVDAECKLKAPSALPLLTIDLKGAGESALTAQKQVLAIRNTGVEEIVITGIKIEETEGTQSSGQFSIPPNAIFLAKSYDDIQQRAAMALADDLEQGAALPVALPPFQPGYNETALFIVVTYSPDDLQGSNGEIAGVGSATSDRARIKFTTNDDDFETMVTGLTTILETPPLELYFKTPSGTKAVTNGGSFPFKGVTAATEDIAFPLFLRVADSAEGAVRITSVAIENDDSANFKWLDTAEKIAAVQPAQGKGMRCSIIRTNGATGEVIDESFDLQPVSLTAPGFDVQPGAYTLETMPLFGCADFHIEKGQKPSQRLYKTGIVVKALQLDKQGMPAKNPDGSAREMALTAQLLAAIEPRSGKLVMRISQTMSAILNPQFPSFSSISAHKEIVDDLASGRMKKSDLEVYLSAIVLDPFDDMEITTADGKEAVSHPNDGVTGVFRTINSYPTSKNYDDEFIKDYVAPIFDSSLPAGQKGVFEDYPNVPEGVRTNGWRIFTSALSYPGPLAPPEKRPRFQSDCLTVNPCTEEGQKMFTDAFASGGKGACAYFFASGGRYDSPAFHTEAEMPGGERTNLCNRVDEPQDLLDVNTGRYSVDGRMEFEEVGFRFFGPTYFHNPGGPLGDFPPLDEVFHMGFTTGVIAPRDDPELPNVIPEERINLAQGEYKINLTDPALPSPICENNTGNRTIKGRRFSSWKYINGLLFKDAEATVPAGCPEEGNDYTGGTAYLRGRDIDHETGILTVVASGKFSSLKDLSFAFKDVMIFVILNGWVCDPLGAEEEFEGGRCYDIEVNERDARSHISIMD